MQNLFRKYLENQCSPAEVNELLQYFNAGENELLLRSLITEKLEFIDKDDDESQWNQATEHVYLAIKKQIDEEKIKVIPVFRRTWFRVAAAAVLLIGAFALYKTVSKNNSPQQEIVKTNTEKKDIAPGGNKAVLTLADGSQIILDSAANGNLASQGNTKLIKLDNGQLAYKGSDSPPAGGDGGEVLYNTITTPKGGQYQLVLSDGSKVWLNAASSLRFPATFVGNERKVELTGEGYFEITKNSSMPFRVNVAGKSEVEVSGTHFNINSYADETTINTTLLEGSVKVTELSTQESLLIIPGQQTQISKGIKIVNNVDTDAIVAWKSGLFHFIRADVKTIMRQIGRWYNVDIQFEGDISKKTFSAIVSRNNNISEVLKIMEAAGIQFRIGEKKIIVTK